MDMAGWRAYQNSKWAKVAHELPGMSWSQYGQDGNTFAMAIDHAAFGEQHVIIGRPATIVARPFLGQGGYQDAEIVEGGENVPLSTMREIIAAWRQGVRWQPAPPVRK